MPRFFQNQKQKHGLAPGSLVFIGNKKMQETQISLMSWNAEEYIEKSIHSPNEIMGFFDKYPMTWINIYGIHDTEKIQQFGEILNLSGLLLEDVLNTDQRPKFDDGETTQGFILKALEYEPKIGRVIADQISFIAGSNFVISFQEKRGHFFESVRERIRTGKGRVRVSGPDYLVYILLDTLVDNYLDIIGNIGEQIEELGNKIITDPSSEMAGSIYNFKIEMSILRKSIRPLKELILLWLKSETGILQKKTKSYILDLSDLATQAEENIEIYSTLLSEGFNMYNASLANRSNEIMKVLTIFAAVFIPLTFFAGLYGMNFDYMPELHFRYSYPIFIVILFTTGIGLFMYFKRKKWF